MCAAASSSLVSLVSQQERKKAANPVGCAASRNAGQPFS